MTDDAARKRRAAILAEYAEEEAESAEVEIAENAAALSVPLSLRVTKDLDGQLRRRAAAEQIPASALIRRILTQAVAERGTGLLTVEDVEEIARRVVRETIDC